jgi:hypothetical protein
MTDEAGQGEGKARQSIAATREWRVSFHKWSNTFIRNTTIIVYMFTFIQLGGEPPSYFPTSHTGERGQPVQKYSRVCNDHFLAAATNRENVGIELTTYRPSIMPLSLCWTRRSSATTWRLWSPWFKKVTSTQKTFCWLTGKKALDAHRQTNCLTEVMIHEART